MVVNNFKLPKTTAIYVNTFSHILVYLKHFEVSLTLQIKIQPLGMTHKGLCDQVPDLALAPLLLNVCPSSTKLLVFLILWYSHLHRPLFLISSSLWLSHTHSFISTHLFPGSLPWAPKWFVFTLDPEFPTECVFCPYEPPISISSNSSINTDKK